MSQNITSTSAAVKPTERTNLAAPAATHLSHKPLKQVQNLDDLMNNLEFRKRVAESLPRHMTPDRMLRTMIAAVRKAPLLAKADIRDLIGCFLTSAQCGLEPNSPLQHMHLIPFKRTKFNPATRQREDAGIEVQAIFGYPGLLELSYRSPLVKSISAAVVFEGDDFDFSMGTESFVRHRPMGRSDRILYAYSVAQLADGHAFRVMPWAEVETIRNRSQAYQMALRMKEDAESKGWRVPAAWTEAPWVKFEAAMAAKTPFRALSKWLPRSIEMASVVVIDEAQERRRNIDWGSIIDAPDGDYVSAAANAAEAPPADDEGPAEQQQQATGSVFAGVTFPADPRADMRTGTGPYTEAPVEQGGDPGPQPDQRQAAAPEPKPDPKPEPKARAARAKPADLPDFSAGLLDQFGDEIGGAGFSVRLDFANAYATAWEACDSEAATEALAEHNAEALVDAKQDRKAAAMIDGLGLPTARMKREAKEAEAAANAEAARAKAAAEAEAIETAKREAAAAEEAKPAAAEDKDRTWAEALCADAEKSTLSDVQAMVAHAGIRAHMGRLRTERPELYAMVEKAFAARLARKA